MEKAVVKVMDSITIVILKLIFTLRWWGYYLMFAWNNYDELKLVTKQEREFIIYCERVKFNEEYLRKVGYCK